MLKNQDKFRYIDYFARFWYYHPNTTDSILLETDNNILKINSMKDLIKIDLILERCKL